MLEWVMGLFLLHPITPGFAMDNPNRLPSLWEIASPIEETTRANVFSFTVPGTSSCIAIGYTFFSDAGCTASLATQAYMAIIVDSDHANKTYFISPAGLFSIANLVAATNAQCVKQTDEFNHSNNVTQAVTCSSGPDTCTSLSGAAALPSTLTDNAPACAY